MRDVGLLTMESIDFQNKIIYKELCGSVKSLGKNSGTDSFIDAALAIQSIVKHHTDMKVKLVFDTIGVGSYIIVPEITNSHVLFSSGVISTSNRDGLTMIRKAKSAVAGSVNTKTNRVTGVFREVELVIHMPMSDIRTGFLTTEEACAIFLHELGHGQSYFEYIARSATTNQILAGITKGLDGSDTYDNKQMLLTEVAKTVGLSTVDINELAATQDKRVIYTVLVTAMNKEYAKEVGYDIYDRTTAEALADQYATRMGAGRELVTGLDKMYKKYGNISYRTSTSYLLIEAMKISMIVLTPYFLIAAPVGFTTLSAYLGIIGMVMILSDSTEVGVTGTYDTPGDRFLRVRLQMVEKLKNQNLSSDEVSAMQDDIAAIDTIRAAVNDRRQFFGVIDDFITSTRRFNRDMKLLQQSLEKLASNDLFLAAAKLTQASKTK